MATLDNGWRLTAELVYAGKSDGVTLPEDNEVR
jgi:hypothetical protein